MPTWAWVAAGLAALYLFTTKRSDGTAAPAAVPLPGGFRVGDRIVIGGGHAGLFTQPGLDERKPAEGVVVDPKGRSVTPGGVPILFVLVTDSRFVTNGQEIPVPVDAVRHAGT